MQVISRQTNGFAQSENRVELAVGLGNPDAVSSEFDYSYNAETNTMRFEAKTGNTDHPKVQWDNRGIKKSTAYLVEFDYDMNGMTLPPVGHIAYIGLSYTSTYPSERVQLRHNDPVTGRKSEIITTDDLGTVDSFVFRFNSTSAYDVGDVLTISNLSIKEYT